MPWNGLAFAYDVGCVTWLALNGFAWCITEHNGQGVDHSIVHILHAALQKKQSEI